MNFQRLFKIRSIDNSLIDDNSILRLSRQNIWYDFSVTDIKKLRKKRAENYLIWSHLYQCQHSILPLLTFLKNILKSCGISEFL